jgi:ASC-1-like (ASCH) protein
MRTWRNHRKEPYFSFVRDGVKTVEGRLNKGKYSQIKPGDQIIVQSLDESESFAVVVVDARKYPTIKDMLESEDLSKLLPDKKTLQEALEVYREFYTEDQEKEFGAVAIQVRLVK